MSELRGCVSLLRFQQWIKNGFVLAPVLFAGELTRLSSVLTAAAACLSFCLLSSSVYVLNDWFGRERDRQHPAKSARPIAAGIVPAWLARLVAATLLGCALLIAGMLTTPAVIAIELGYLGLNLAYSLYLLPPRRHSVYQRLTLWRLTFSWRAMAARIILPAANKRPACLRRSSSR